MTLGTYYEYHCITVVRNQVPWFPTTCNCGTSEETTFQHYIFFHCRAQGYCEDKIMY